MAGFHSTSPLPPDTKTVVIAMLSSMSPYSHAVVDGQNIHPNLLRLMRHYAHGGHMPKRQQFRPEELYWLYGYYYVVDVLGGGDYRFGYCGHCWQLFYGIDLTGERLSEVEEHHPQLKLRRVEFDTVVADRHPSYSTGHMHWQDGNQASFHRLIIPFSGENGAPSMLIVAAQSNITPTQLLHYKIHGNPKIDLQSQDWSAITQQVSQPAERLNA